MKVKKIKENEPFEMNGKVFIYTVVDGKINLSRSTQKVKKEFVPPTLNEVVHYFTSNGYTAESGQKCYEYYNRIAIRNDKNEVVNWVDKNNAVIKNWRSKAAGVWFKDENKQTPTHNQITQMVR